MAHELQAWRPEDDALRLRIDRERDVEYLLILVLAVVNCDRNRLRPDLAESRVVAYPCS